MCNVVVRVWTLLVGMCPDWPRCCTRSTLRPSQHVLRQRRYRRAWCKFRKCMPYLLRGSLPRRLAPCGPTSYSAMAPPPPLLTTLLVMLLPSVMRRLLTRPRVNAPPAHNAGVALLHLSQTPWNLGQSPQRPRPCLRRFTPWPQTSKRNSALPTLPGSTGVT